MSIEVNTTLEKYRKTVECRWQNYTMIMRQGVETMKIRKDGEAHWREVEIDYFEKDRRDYDRICTVAYNLGLKR